MISYIPMENIYFYKKEWIKLIKRFDETNIKIADTAVNNPVNVINTTNRIDNTLKIGHIRLNVHIIINVM